MIRTKILISECVRQLSDFETYLKLTEEEVKNVIMEIQNELNAQWKAIYTKGIARKRRLTFCYQK